MRSSLGIGSCPGVTMTAAAPSDSAIWLSETVALPAPQRRQKLSDWQSAPQALASHPRAEHLLPLMVAAGASEDPGQEIFADQVMGVLAAGYRF